MAKPFVWCTHHIRWIPVSCLLSPVPNNTITVLWSKINKCSRFVLLCVRLLYMFRRRSLLRIYVANNVMVHARAGKDRTNLKERIASHRDLVFQQTLLRSSLVCKVVDSFNVVEGNTRESRDSRRRILSLIARDFPYLVLKTLPWRIPYVGTKFINRSLTRKCFVMLEDIMEHSVPIFIPHRSHKGHNYRWSDKKKSTPT